VKNIDISGRANGKCRITVYIFEKDKEFLKELRKKLGGASYSLAVRYLINVYKEAVKDEKV